MTEKNTPSTGETVETVKVSEPEAVATHAQKEESESGAKTEQNFAQERALAPLSRDRSKDDVDDEADEEELEPSTKQSEKAKEESPKVESKKVEKPVAEKPVEVQPTEAVKSLQQETPTVTEHAENTASQREPSRIDTRIIQVAQQIHALRGNDIPDTQDILAELNGMTFEQKREALNTLFANRRELRGVQEETPEEREALMEAEIERRMALKEQEVQQKQFSENIISTIHSHPELDEKSNQFNKDMHDLVYDLVKSGVLASVAWERVSKLSQFKEQQVEKEAKKDEIRKENKELSGAFGAQGKPAETKPLSKNPEALKKLRMSNPKKYNRLVALGEI